MHTPRAARSAAVGNPGARLELLPRPCRSWVCRPAGQHSSLRLAPLPSNIGPTMTCLPSGWVERNRLLSYHSGITCQAAGCFNSRSPRCPGLRCLDQRRPVFRLRMEGCSEQSNNQHMGYFLSSVIYSGLRTCWRFAQTHPTCVANLVPANMILFLHFRTGARNESAG